MEPMNPDRFDQLVRMLERTSIDWRTPYAFFRLPETLIISYRELVDRSKHPQIRLVEFFQKTDTIREISYPPPKATYRVRWIEAEGFVILARALHGSLPSRFVGYPAPR